MVDRSRLFFRYFVDIVDSFIYYIEKVVFDCIVSRYCDSFISINYFSIMS